MRNDTSRKRCATCMSEIQGIGAKAKKDKLGKTTQRCNNCHNASCVSHAMPNMCRFDNVTLCISMKCKTITKPILSFIICTNMTTCTIRSFNSYVTLRTFPSVLVRIKSVSPQLPDSRWSTSTNRGWKLS